MSDLFEFAIESCVIIIGICEFLKNLNVKNITKYMPYLSLIASIILGLLYCKSIESFTTWSIVSAIGTALAITQLSYEIVVKSITSSIETFLTKQKEKNISE